MQFTTRERGTASERASLTNVANKFEKKKLCGAEGCIWKGICDNGGDIFSWGAIMGKTQKNYWLIYFTPSYDQIETSVREGENVSDSESD